MKTPLEQVQIPEDPPLRPCARIALFAARMQNELWANKHKGDWDEWKPDMVKLRSEFLHHEEKLRRAVMSNSPEGISEFTADLANILMKMDEMYGIGSVPPVIPPPPPELDDDDLRLVRPACGNSVHGVGVCGEGGVRCCSCAKDNSPMKVRDIRQLGFNPLDYPPYNPHG